MGSAVFGYKNLCLESGVAFSPTSQAAAHLASNLGNPHPYKFWRMTTLTDQKVDVTFPSGALSYDTVAVLYAVASPHVNLVASGHSLLSASWGPTNVSIGYPNAALTAGVPAVTLAADGAGSVQHYIRQTYTAPTGPVDGWKIAASLYLDISATAGGAHSEWEIGNSDASRIFVQVNGSTGAVNTSGSAGAWTLTSATTSLISGSVYRVSLIGTTNTPVNVRSSLYVLNSSFSKTYTAVAQSIRCGGLTVEKATTVGSSVDSKNGRLSLWGVDDDFSTYRPIALSRSQEDFYANRGFVHSYIRTGSIASSRPTVYFHDPHNAAGQLDISNLYIGPTWTPTRNIDEAGGEDWSFDPETGGRVLTLTVGWASKADAFSEAMPMALRAGVGVKSSATADGGQEYRVGKIPILVIVDPDDTTHAQERMIYGFLDNVRERSKMYVSDMDGAGNPGVCYALEFTIKEVLP